MDGKSILGSILILVIIVFCALCAGIIVVSGVGLAAGTAAGGGLFVATVVCAGVIGVLLTVFSRTLGVLYFLFGAAIVGLTMYLRG